MAKFFKNRRIYVTWLLSYFAILLIFIVMSSIFYMESLKITKSEISKSNVMLLDTVKKAIDESLVDAKNLDSQLAVDQNVQIYAKPNTNNYFYNSFDSLVFMEEIKKYRDSNKHLDNFYLLYHEKNECITAFGKWDMDLFYDINVMRDGIFSQESWEYLNNGKTKNGFMVLNSTIGGTRNNVIGYVSTIPFSYDYNPEATIVVPLSNRFFSETFEVFGEHSVFIIDEDDNVIISNNDNSVVQSITYKELKDGDNALYLEKDGKSLVYSYVRSDETNWKYVVAMPTEDYDGVLSRLKNLSVVCVILACLIGIGVSVFSSEKNYRPISDIMKILPAGDRENQNELGIIRNTINDIIKEQQQIMNSVDEQKNKLRYFFLTEVIKGVTRDEEIIKKGLDAYDIKQLSDMYGVILVYVEDMGDITYGDTDISNLSESSKTEAWNLVQFIIRNIGEELACEKHMGLVMNIEGIMCLFMNFDSDDSESAEDDMEEIARRLQLVLNTHFHIITTLAIGGAQEGYGGITSSYKQALDSLEYRMLEAENKVICYKDINYVKGRSFYKYDLAVENELIKNIKIGNYEVTERIIIDLINYNFRENNISVRMAKLFQMELFSTILKVMYEISRTYQNDLADKVQRVENLLKNENIDEVEKELLSALKEVCAYITDNKKSHNEGLFETILTELEANIYDPNLNTQYLADFAGITVNYLLRFFKAQTGTGLMDYIHEKRVKKAKELLSSTNLSVNEIAENVGYCSMNTFNRIFKKIEGVPPGQYRKNKSQLE